MHMQRFIKVTGSFPAMFDNIDRELGFLSKQYNIIKLWLCVLVQTYTLLIVMSFAKRH